MTDLLHVVRHSGGRLAVRLLNNSVAVAIRSMATLARSDQRNPILKFSRYEIFITWRPVLNPSIDTA